MTEATGVFDAALTRTLRDEAMQRVEDNAKEEFKAAARAAIILCLRTMELITTDDVRRILIQQEVTTHEWKALGPCMTSAAKDGLIVKTNMQRKSPWSAAHGRDKRVWRRV